MNETTQKINNLGYIDRMQASDVLDYLKKLKRFGHRGQTSREIIFNFYGIISQGAIYNQLERLKKWKAIKETKIKHKGHEIIIYEAN